MFRLAPLLIIAFLVENLVCTAEPPEHSDFRLQDAMSLLKAMTKVYLGTKMT